MEGMKAESVGRFPDSKGEHLDGKQLVALRATLSLVMEQDAASKSEVHLD